MDLAEQRSPQRAVGKTIAEVIESTWRCELHFTDGTKLQIEPGDVAFTRSALSTDDPAVELIFQDDPAAD